MNIRMKEILQSNEGFSLLGALIGMAIFIIGMLGVFAMQTKALTSTGKSVKLSQSISWAQNYAEQLMAVPYDDPDLDASQDPLEPINTFTGTADGIHTATEGPYNVSWAVFTSTQNGQSLQALGLNTNSMFDKVATTQNFTDIPSNSKLVLVHVAHPIGDAARIAFIKPNI